jgi:hypothetical protein
LTEEEKKRLLKQHFHRESNKLRRRASKSRAKDFQILSKIGKGGFGDVRSYKCYDRYYNIFYYRYFYVDILKRGIFMQ